jgi:glycine C-acetyltransferase
MFKNVQSFYQNELKGIREAGLYKNERVIESPQAAHIKVAGREVINFCANNYLGLANNQRLRDAAKEGLDLRDSNNPQRA